jgi:hypothetical protein
MGQTLMRLVCGMEAKLHGLIRMRLIAPSSSSIIGIRPL